jgi:hypothetical protein
MPTDEIEDTLDELKEALRARPAYWRGMRHEALAIGKRLFQEGGIDLLKRVRSELPTKSLVDSIWTGTSDDEWGDVMKEARKAA